MDLKYIDIADLEQARDHRLMAKPPAKPPAKRAGKPKKRDPLRSKALICQAALECFTRNGADRTTILEIARHARVPTSLIHYYFDSQEELFAQVFEIVLERIQGFVMTPLGAAELPEAALFAYIRAHFEWARQFPAEFAIWMYFYYASTLSARNRELNSRVREGGRVRVAALIDAGTRMGRFRPLPGETPESLALEIQVLVTGAWVIGPTENPVHRTPLYEAVERRVKYLLGTTSQ